MNLVGEKEVGMSQREIQWLVEDYIGVNSGYLRRFTWAKHEAFYHKFCDLDVDVLRYRENGHTTRSGFIQILKDVSPRDQAKIIRGTFKMLPLAQVSDYKNRKEKEAVRDRLLKVAVKLESDGLVDSPEPEESSETVFEALRSADVLLKHCGAEHAVDRAHTAVHGYLKKLCADRGVPLPADPALTAVFKLLRERPEFPEFSTIVAHDAEATRINGGLETARVSLNTIRNRATLAHPNELLLEGAEAMLCINLSRAFIAYLDSKLNQAPAAPKKGPKVH